MNIYAELNLDRMSRGPGYIWPWMGRQFVRGYGNEWYHGYETGWYDSGFMLEPDHCPPALEAEA